MSVDARTLIFRPRRGVALLVHGPTPPSDEDWARYLDAVEAYGRQVPTVKLLVVTDNAGPSTSQREALSRRAPKNGRTAVVTSSTFARAIVTLIGWTEPNIRAFAPAAVKTALDYLGVPATEHAMVLDEVTRLRGRFVDESFVAVKPRFSIGQLANKLRSTTEKQMSELLDAFEKRDREFQTELRDARAFQQRLVALPEIHGAKVASFYEPMGLIGGDLYAISQDGSKVRVFIADATGHGIRAAMTTMFIKNAYESVARLPSPSAFLERLNDSISSTYKSTEMMFTAACADIDTASGEVTVASAGHPPACAVKGRDLVLLEPDGAPMGVKAGVKFESTSLTLEPGDGLYLYTDGISEARLQRENFGESRLHESIRRAHVAREDVAAHVRSELLAYVGNYHLSDDAAFIGVRL